jgi:hypothetical protein
VARSDKVQRRANQREQRIDWRWRWTLHRWGRHDGRYRKPDPLSVSSPVRTSVRSLLEAQMAEVVERIRVQGGEEIARHQRELRSLDMRIAQLEDGLDRLAAELAAVDAKRPAADKPAERHAGDRGKSENVVRSRRRREFEREQARVRKAQQALEGQLQQCRETWAGLTALIEGLERAGIDEAHRVRAVYEHAEAVYLRALLKRHPEGDLLRLMLDESPFALPEWATRNDLRPSPTGLS